MLQATLRSEGRDRWIRVDEAEVFAALLDIDEIERNIVGALIQTSERLPLAQHRWELVRAETLPVGAHVRSLLRAVAEGDEETSLAIAKARGFDPLW